MKLAAEDKKRKSTDAEGEEGRLIVKGEMK